MRMNGLEFTLMEYLFQTTKYNFVHGDSNDEIIFNLATGSLSVGGVYPADLQSTQTELGYILENTDEFGITGKFIEL